MGARGPAPKPTKLKILAGNPGHRPINRLEPEPTPGAPDPPAWLPAEALAEWRRVVPELDRLKLLTKVDRAVLAAYCVAWSELVTATQKLEAEGRVVDVVVRDRHGEEVGTRAALHPAVKLQRDAFARVKAYLGEIGLSPSSRSRLQVPDAPEANDPIAELLRRQAEARKA